MYFQWYKERLESSQLSVTFEIKKYQEVINFTIHREYVVPISDKTYLELTHTYSQKLFSLPMLLVVLDKKGFFY